MGVTGWSTLPFLSHWRMQVPAQSNLRPAKDWPLKQVTGKLFCMFPFLVSPVPAAGGVKESGLGHEGLSHYLRNTLVARAAEGNSDTQAKRGLYGSSIGGQGDCRRCRACFH